MDVLGSSLMYCVLFMSVNGVLFIIYIPLKIDDNHYISVFVFVCTIFMLIVCM